MSFLTIVALGAVFFWVALRISDARWSKGKVQDVGFGQAMRVPRRSRSKRARVETRALSKLRSWPSSPAKSERSRRAVADVATFTEPSSDAIDARSFEASSAPHAARRTQHDLHALDQESVAQHVIPSAVIAALLVAGLSGFLALVIWANTAG